MTQTESLSPNVEDAAERPRTMRDALKEPGSVAMSAPLERLMKEVAPDNDSGGAMLRFERRLGILERAFADIVERHEKSMADRMASLGATDERVAALSGRVDRAATDHKDGLAALRGALGDACMRLNALEAERPAVAQPADAAPHETAWAGALDVAPAAPAADVSQENATPSARKAEGPSYLSAARRAANSASVGDDLSKAHTQAPRRKSRVKLLAFGCAAPLMVAAAAVFVLNRHPVKAALPPAPKPVAQAVLSAPPEMETALPSEPQAADLASVVPADQLEDKAKAGDAASARDLGLAYLSGQGVEASEETAAQWLLRASFGGDAAAEYWLATLYGKGVGVPQDADQAKHYYEAAAKDGDPRAMHWLALANLEGSDRDKNEAEAVRLFTEAAGKGFAESAFDLALLYEKGEGVERDLKSAYQWYMTAASSGDAAASTRMTELAKFLKPEESKTASGE